ncbi:MAG: hypothetical protein P4L33_01020 [Capsulimonadaceae bacterium]|nr:hypothetical protein [Capsulimonadaceae bacterium]
MNVETRPSTASSSHDHAHAADRGAKPVRWGLVLAISIPLIVLSCGWIANSEMKTGVTEVTISSLFSGVTFILFVVTLANLLVRRFGARTAALHQAELMSVYSTLSMSSVVAGVGNMGFFAPYLANPFYYANQINGWKSFWYLLPRFSGPRDPDILAGFYNGQSTFFTAKVMQAWALPLLSWSLFFLVLLWMTLCTAAILRKRWADDEHLAFPVIAVPLEITREGAPVLRNKMLWIGFAVPCFFHSINSLHYLYPTLPFLPINHCQDYVQTGSLQFPLTGAGTLFYMLHPAGVGLGYLINTDVSFSLWFFYLLKKVVDIGATCYALRDPTGAWSGDGNNQFPYWGYQGWGAWLALGIAALWVGRKQFSQYFARVFHGDPDGIDSGEAMSARTAVGGLALGFLALCGFVWSWGGSWWLPVVFIGIYLLLMVTLSRIRAETAVLSSELLWIDPQSMITTVAGSANLSHLDLAHTSALSWFNLDYRAAAMPHQLESLVGVERSGGKLKPLAAVLMITAAVAIVAALLWDLQLYYVNGAATGHVNSWRVTTMGNAPWRHLENWLHNPKAADPHAPFAMVAGIAITLTLAALRARFAAFPFSPAAYALNTTFANDFFWCDMFVAWLVKTLILRYGGIKLYTVALPFFLGLVLGDFVTGSVWSIIGTAMNTELYRTFAT